MYISRSKITDDFKKDTCKLLHKTGNTPSDHYGEAIKVNFGSNSMGLSNYFLIK